MNSVLTAAAPQILRRNSWLPEDLRDEVPAHLRDWAPQTILGGIVKRALPYLPDDIRAELVDRVRSIMICESSLALRVIRRDGSIEDYGVVGHKQVTATGVLYLANAMAATASYDITLFKFHGLGHTNTGEAATDQILAAEETTAYNPDSTRATGSVAAATSGNNATFQTVGTNTVDGAVSAVEHGIFTRAATGAYAAPANVMLDRTVFSVVTLASGDGIASTYTLTLNSGG